MFDLNFYHGKRVLVTGHTGFKGAWLWQILKGCGAQVLGYSLEPPTTPNLFELISGNENGKSVIGDIRDFDKLKAVYDNFMPEIVIHLAAQPIVRDSYKEPKYTYETNVIGTLNLLECIRLNPCAKSVLNVTTDKVYENRETDHGYTEDEKLDGYDPYSNSKSCSELVTHSYKRSFLDALGIPVSTARAGNVIGGGDFANDRIIPDCVRAAESGNDIVVRNPFSTRPFQHVLEPLFAYLMIAKRQYENNSLAGYYNVGPDDVDCVNTGKLVTLFCEKWGGGIKWINKHDGGPHEAGFLKLDNAHIKNTFGWRCVWHIDEAVEKTVQWTKVYISGENVTACMNKQIAEFIERL